MERVIVSAPFGRFFDDAAIFPPGRAALPDAVRAHLVRRGSALGALVGPLLVTPARLEEAARLARVERAREELDADPLRVALVVSPDDLVGVRDLAGRAWDGLEVVGLEVKTNERWSEQIDAAAELASGTVGVHVELSSAAIRDGAIDQLARTPARLKFRTGGLEAVLFPSVTELAAVVHAAVGGDVSFKLTAGLHRAVRHRGAETGFAHHGFVNIAVAVDAARSGAELAEVVQALELTDGAELASRLTGATPQWRSSFESFGTCSILEPVQTLADLDLLDPALLDLTQGSLA